MTALTGSFSLRSVFSGGRYAQVAAVILSLIILAPIAAVFFMAAGDSEGLWGHLFETVLPRYVANTLLLMAGVGILSLVFGISTAWVVTRYEFPGRGIFEWALMLPFAIPAYIIAYTYTDFLEYAGPVQAGLREWFGWRSARDYWFPEIRSMYGAILVMGAVLYPYVYLMARTAFITTPASLFEVARLSGRNGFFGVSLPMARPAIVAGLALVLMETISDFGTVEYFAIETLTLGIFNVWLGMNSLPAAAQIACVCFLFIVVLLVSERFARAKQRFSETTRRQRVMVPQRASGYQQAVCFAVCLTPIIIGFVVPVSVLLGFILKGYSLDFSDPMVAALLNTLALSVMAAVSVIAVAVLLGFVAAYSGASWLKSLIGLASIGYAFPGVIVAIGVVTFFGAADDVIDFTVASVFAGSYGGWLTSGVGLVVFACVVRFQAVGFGAVSSGLQRVPRNLVDASRSLGHGPLSTMKSITFPLTRLSLVAGAMLVFVDVMKELPMTLLLRPFNYETLATFVYQYAKDELLEEAALPALIIVATGVIPVAIMNASMRRLSRNV